MKELTNNEEKVLNIIGDVVVSGHPNTLSSCVSFDDMEISVQYDHNYTTTQETQPSSSMEEEVGEEEKKESKTLQTHYPEKKVTKPKKLFKTRRLENSIQATERLAEQTQVKLEMKQKYYDSKLDLLKKLVEAQNTIAMALENIAAALQ